MPCHVKQTAAHFASIPAIKPGFAYQELLGNAEKEKQATFGIFSIEKSEPLTYKNVPFDGFAAILEGEANLEDLDKPGEPVLLKSGDIIHLVAGTSVTWSTLSKCSGVFVLLKPFGDLSFATAIH
ncbi:hypothetical protein F5I97DRAFT_1922752 [Phlebopus sp. FC_14]|nr:hypothetical protein F5I97DRAFT_1922752 [Phlebopus sp. FC_14]